MELSEIIKQKLAKLQAEMGQKRGGINSRRADVISELMGFMREYTLNSLLKNATNQEKGRF